MTKHAREIQYTVLDKDREPKMDPKTFRGHVLTAVKTLTENASDGIAGLSDIHVEAMKFVWTDGKTRSESDIFRLVQDVMHQVGDTTASAAKWLHKDGGRRLGTGTGGRHGQRKHDPIVIPAGKFVFVSDSDDPKTAKLVDPRPLHDDSELKFKLMNVEDVREPFMTWLAGLKGSHVKIRNAAMSAAFSLDPKDRDAAILAWHTGGRNVDAARKAFSII